MVERRGEGKGKGFRGRVRYDGSWPTEAYRASRTVQSDGERAEGDQKAVGVHPGGDGGCHGDQPVLLRGVREGETTD